MGPNELRQRSRPTGTLAEFFRSRGYRLGWSFRPYCDRNQSAVSQHFQRVFFALFRPKTPDVSRVVKAEEWVNGGPWATMQYVRVTEKQVSRRLTKVGCSAGLARVQRVIKFPVCSANVLITDTG
jgi:hypothetical protein